MPATVLGLWISGRLRGSADATGASVELSDY